MTRLLLALLLTACSTQAAFFDNWDREAYLWRRNVVTNSSSVSGTSYNSAIRFMQHLRQFGQRTKIADCNIYLGADLNAALMRIIWDLDPSPDPLVNNHNFVSGDYTEATGLTGNGSSKYLDIRISPNLIGTFLSLSSYVRTAVNENGCVIGVQNVGAGCYMLQSYGDATTYASISGDVTFQFGVADSAGVGCYTATRTTTNFAAIYKNGTQIASLGTGPASAVATSVIYVHAFNNAGATILYSTKALSFWAVGYGMTDTGAANLAKAVDRIQYDAKRKVP
jgi:hypothetical protein